MIDRIIAAVDDSPPAFAAASFAIELARQISAELRVVTVAEPDREPDVVLRHVAAMADEAGVAATTEILRGDGQPFEAVLAAAIGWQADLVVMGRSDTRRTGRPYVGSQTEHLLEFSEVPVLVVPEPRPAP